MAISNLNLNVRANTARAMRDFKRFSDTLDNKFLLSGLKLDVIRTSLSQINREFQRSIGEQGLASASSLRAAQNQASLLTQTFKGFASESALAINRDIGTALNSLAVRAGGTMRDVQKTLAATPFISIKMPEGARDKLMKDMLSLQRDMRRAGVTENFGGIAQQFLSGRVQAMDLIGSEDAGAAFIGAEILKRSGGRAQITDPRQRSEILAQVIGDQAVIDQFKEMARRTMGYRLILEDLNTKLFNPEFGLFGSLRKVMGADGRYTTMFDQVERLTNSVFGPDGAFTTFFKRIGSVFDVQDPMQPLIGLVQFSERVAQDIKNFFEGATFTRILEAFKAVFDSAVEFINGPTVKGVMNNVRVLFDDLGVYFASDQFSGVVVQAKDTFGRIFQFLGDFVKTFGQTIRQIGTGEFQPGDIQKSIRGIGETVRKFIRDIGSGVRDFDLAGKEGDFVSEIGSTLFVELGKTAVVLVKELFATLLNKIPEIATQVLPAINSGINSMLTEAFGQVGGKIAKFVLGLVGGFLPGPVGAIARASAAGDITGGGGNMFSIAAMGAASLLGPSALFGAARFGRGLFGRDEARMSLLTRLSSRIHAVEELYNKRMRDLHLSGMQRSPLSRLLAERLAPSYQLTPDVLGGPNRLMSDIRRRPIPQAPYNVLGQFSDYGRITAESSMFNYFPVIEEPERLSIFGRFSRAERQRRDRFIQLNRELSYRQAMERYNRSVVPATGPSTSAFRGLLMAGPWSPEDIMMSSGALLDLGEFNRQVTQSGGSSRRRNPEKWGYSSPIGPLPEGSTDPWTYVGEGRGWKGGGYNAYMESQLVREGGSLRAKAERAKREEARLRVKGVGAGREAFSEWMSELIGSRGYGEMEAYNRGMGITGGYASEVERRYRRRYGLRGRASSLIRRIPGRGILGAGLTVGGLFAADAFGRSSQAQELAGKVSGFIERPGIGSVLGGVAQGASMGAIAGPWGAAIGGVIGGVVSLMDKETRAGVAEFANGIGRWFTNTIDWIAKGTKENFKKAQDTLGSALRTAVNGFITIFNGILTTFQLIPRLVISMVEKIPGAGSLPGFEQAKNIANFQLQLIPPNNYDGKGFYGPAMAHEARMSGRKPLVINDGEFVIPAGSGMSTLANLVGQNLTSTGVIRKNNSSQTVINVSLNLSSSAFVADANDLINKLRDPVHQIINEAWIQATQTIPVRTS